MPAPPDFEFLPPWKSLTDSPESRALAEKLTQCLRDELPHQHALAHLEFAVVARRNDRDVVLTEVKEGNKTLAEVHMTWRKETNPRFPRAKFFDSWQHWAQASMTAANFDFTAGEESRGH